MKKACVVLLVLIGFHFQNGFERGLPEASLVEDCIEFVEEYEYFLNQICNAKASFELKKAIVEASVERFYLTDSVLLFDDLYLQVQNEQYFQSKLYLITLISWYPNGARIVFSDIEFGKFYIHKKGSYIQANVFLERELEGENFLKEYQIDTLGLEFHLQLAFNYQGGESVLEDPKSLSITPRRKSFFVSESYELDTTQVPGRIYDSNPIDEERDFTQTLLLSPEILKSPVPESSNSSNESDSIAFDEAMNLRLELLEKSRARYNQRHSRKFPKERPWGGWLK